MTKAEGTKEKAVKKQKQPKQPKKQTAALQATIERVIAVLKNPPPGCDMLYCRSKGGFSLNKMTEEQEWEFLEAVRDTSILVVSFPLGSKTRFKGAFGDGASMYQPEVCRWLYIPHGIFGKRWYRNGKHTKNVLVI